VNDGSKVLFEEASRDGSYYYEVDKKGMANSRRHAGKSRNRKDNVSGRFRRDWHGKAVSKEGVCVCA
jgi:hypothetical protein